MKFSLITAFALSATTSVVAQGCTARQRIANLQYITDAFNEPDFFKSAVLIQGMNLQRDCPAIVSVNGAPGIQFDFDASTSKDFANVVRQAFTKVVSKFTDYGNGTTLMDAQVTLGLLHTIDLPVYATIKVPIEHNLTTCQITKLPAFVQVPTDIGGNPISPPLIPMIPGLRELPGFREVLKLLIPAIGNLYNV